MSEEPTCARCGLRREPGTLTALAWVSEHDPVRGGVRRWLCPDCARTHVREIESKLSDEWW